MGGNLDWRSGLLAQSTPLATNIDWRDGIPSSKPVNQPSQLNQPQSEHLNPLAKEEESVSYSDNTPYPQWFQHGLELAYKGTNWLDTTVGKGVDFAKDYFESMYGLGDRPIGAPAPLTPEGRIPESERSVVSGAARGVGGLVGGAFYDPRNWPFFAQAELQPLFKRLISAGFTWQMGKGTFQSAKQLVNNWDNMTPEQRAEGLTSTGLGSLLTLAAGHGIFEASPKGKLSTEEHSDLTNIVNNHLTESIKNGDLQGAQDAHDISRELSKGPNDRLLANISIIADKLEKERGQPNLRLTTPEAEKDITSQQGSNITRPVSAPTGETEPATQAPLFAEENLRDNSRDTRGEGTTGIPAIASALNEGNEGIATQGQLDVSLEQLRNLYPEYAHIIGGGEGKAPAIGEGPSEVGAIEGAGAPTPPVISEAIDRNLSTEHGVQVIKPGDDVGLVMRMLGSFSEMARKLNVEGHPLGPLLTRMAGNISNAFIGIARDGTDLARMITTNSHGIVTNGEWQEMVVPMLEDKNININNRPSNIPDPALFSDANGHWDKGEFKRNFPNATPRDESEARAWSAYTVAKDLLESERVTIRDTRRQEYISRNIRTIDPATGRQLSPLETAIKFIPDDYGIENYYPHMMPGEYAVTRQAGVDSHGNPIWEPINDRDILWRQRSEWDAKDAVVKYMSKYPGETLRIQKDNVTLPGKGISDRARLIDLASQVKDASTLITHGATPQDVIDDLYDSAAAKAYGPRRTAMKNPSFVQQRETDLAGYLRDKDSFRDHLLAANRYSQVAAVRNSLLTDRNKIADLANMASVQRPSEFPSPTRYNSAYQYGNILARADSAIEGLEGYPGFSDSYARHKLGEWGMDPNLYDTMGSSIKRLMAVLKLGGNPIRILSHGLQTGWGVLPVLKGGTIYGIDHAYDMKYDSLIKDLAIEHGPTSADIGFDDYTRAYFGRGSSLPDWIRGGTSLAYDGAMWFFREGITTARRVAAIGGYKQALDMGMTPEQARDYARDVVNRSTGEYTPADNSVALRQLPGAVAQFKNFMLKTTQFMYGLKGPQEWGLFLGAVGAMGLVSMPYIRMLSNWVKTLSDGKIDPETELKKAYPRASRGIFGYAGVDVPSGVGLGDLDPFRDNTIGQGLFGPALSDILTLGEAGASRIIGGPSRVGENKLDDAIRNISPEARRIWDEANRLSSGEPRLIDPRTQATIISNLTPTERAQMFAGVTPLRVAEERDIHEYIRNQIKNSKDVKGYFVDKLAQLQVELTQPNTSEADRMEILRQTSVYFKEAQDYNVDTRGITKVIIQRAKEMQMERLQRDYKLAPKSQRPLVYQEQQRFKSEQ